jgi:2-polyprenyl-3-methyl-5-hydroxy-6-metoxy-1,4-benzoquinol methylase
MTIDYHGDPRPDLCGMIDVAGLRVLDVGCGAGAMGAEMKRAGAARVCGIEGNAGAAARARECLDEVVEGDIATVPLGWAPHSFDALVFGDVLEHLVDPAAALARYLPLLVNGGRVIISVPNMRFYLVLLRLLVDRWKYTDSGVRDRTHLRIFTRRSLLDFVLDAGLHVERLERNYRLLEDQSRIGRLGALAPRIAQATIAPWFFRDLMAYQYRVVARKDTPHA